MLTDNVLDLIGNTPLIRLGAERVYAKGEFLTAGKGRLPAQGKDHVSIQCYNGPPDAVHWIRFDDFSIGKLPD